MAHKTYDFSFCPDDGPPRLIRFGQLPGNDWVSMWSPSSNTLFVDRGLYDSLSTMDQHIVLKSRDALITIERHADRTPTLVHNDFQPAHKVAV